MKKKILFFILSFMLVFSYAYADNKKIAESVRLASEANQARQNGDVDKAMALLDESIGLDPKNYMAITALAGIYADYKKDIPKSILLFKEALEINNYDMAHFGLGICYASVGMKEEAKKEFKDAIAVTDNGSLKSSAQRALTMLEKG